MPLQVNDSALWIFDLDKWAPHDPAESSRPQVRFKFLVSCSVSSAEKNACTSIACRSVCRKPTATQRLNACRTDSTPGVRTDACGVLQAPQTSAAVDCAEVRNRQKAVPWVLFRDAFRLRKHANDWSHRGGVQDPWRSRGYELFLQGQKMDWQCRPLCLVSWPTSHLQVCGSFLRPALRD